ncbi:nuclear transport factor 2 family protein [Pseudoxanthomonas suwonensis]|uniref:SnoaL-like domain-containing protein n=1 Tax=Pseudoxanthomonas suwonensis TaxID=314722 RepID=A0A0E3Z3G4_9GAMM|nr:nuclear transport factor 2 family protein [Pseudoxanthomonas suwonensis]AKC87913.1 hypothetical protein WQ53_15195 [Pseudoxanthomonas suwonensis]
MRMLLLLLALLSVAGVYFLGGNRISQVHVESLYAASQQAFHSLDHEALCAMLDRDFEQRLTLHVGGQRSYETLGKQDYCEAQEEILGALRQLGPLPNGRRLVDHRYTLTRISIAPGGRSATVETRATSAIPGIHSTERSTDTLVRRRWKTRVVRSEGTAWVGPAG